LAVLFALGLIVGAAGESGAAQLTLTWSQMSTNEDGFKVERKIGTGGAYSEIGITGANVTTYVDGAVSGGTTYCYRVRAFNGAGHSGYSNEACGTLPVTFSLNVVRAGTGNGSVGSSPGGITCGPDCSEPYAGGTIVTLTATAATGSRFAGWSGGGCGGTGSCVVTLTAGTTVTATFSPATTTASLTVAKAGTGTGTVTSAPSGISCGATCTASYATGTAVTLTATAATGSRFAGWSGGGCGGIGTCVVALTAGTTVTASFSPTTTAMTSLAVAKSGTGTGTVTSAPSGISCGATCTASYATGTAVTLTATAATGSRFAGWSGGGCGGTGSCVVTLTAATTVTATFAPNGPVAEYGFNETSGTTARDTSGYAHHGTISGATRTSQGRFGNALAFDGADDRVTVSDAPRLDLGSSGTMAAWVRLDRLGRWHGIIAKGSVNDDAKHNYAIEVTPANVLRCILGNGASFVRVDSSATLVAGRFYHVACTWTATRVDVYIDGVLSRSMSHALSPAGNTAPLFLGQFGGNADRLDGRIDEVRVYGRALSVSEIRADMTRPIP
jgi:hypothetical protein